MVSKTTLGHVHTTSGKLIRLSIRCWPDTATLPARITDKWAREAFLKAWFVLSQGEAIALEDAPAADAWAVSEFKRLAQVQKSAAKRGPCGRCGGTGWVPYMNEGGRCFACR